MKATASQRPYTPLGRPRRREFRSSGIGQLGVRRRSRLRIAVSRFGRHHLRKKQDAEKGAAVAITWGSTNPFSRLMTDTPTRAEWMAHLTQESSS